MRAAILAGGQGSRIKGLFPDLPKPMIPVEGKPLLQYQVELLVNQGIRDITLMVGYKHEIIGNHFGNGENFGAKITYIIESKPLGTGGALALLPKEDTLILLGDIYINADLGLFIQFHKENESLISLFVHPNSHPSDSDIVVTDGHGKVLSWKSKKEARHDDLRNLVNAGLYLFNGNALPTGEAINRDLERDLIVPVIPSGKLFAYRSTEYVKDMGTPERLAAVAKDIKSGAVAARNLKKRQRAVFVDRDGTINSKNGFIRIPAQMQLIPGAAEAVKLLNGTSFLAICITNQPVIARGEATFEDLEAVHARLDALLGREGAYLDDLFFCPHHPDKGFAGEAVQYKMDCECRKPKPGLLLRAAEKYNIELSQSYMIGDSTSDIAAGCAVSCVTVGVETGSALADGKYVVNPDIICKTLRNAVDLIVASEGLR